MGSRLMVFGLHYSLKYCQKIVCHCKIYPRYYQTHCQIKNKGWQSKLTGISLYSSDSPKKCWQCNYPFKSEFFCQKCKALQEPPEKLNYFQIIGIEENYNLDVKILQQKYRQLQNILHPDRFGNRSEIEKDISETMSSLINKAYNTLLNPLERGLYILSLKNLAIPEDTSRMNPEFLMEIMERNEMVDEALKNREKLVQLTNENDAILEKLSKEVSEAFRKNDLETGKLVLTKMKYYNSLEKRLKNLKRELGIVE